MLIGDAQYAKPQLIHNFIKSKRISEAEQRVRSLLPSILDVILFYADIQSKPRRHRTLVAQYQVKLVKQGYLKTQEVTDIDARLAQGNNDSLDYAILFETHSKLARAFNYRQFPAFEERVMPFLQSLPRQDAKHDPVTDSAGDKWTDDQEYTFLRWISGSGFVSIFHDLLATPFYQVSEHLHAALQFDDHIALRTALRQGNAEIVEALLQTDFYQNTENLNQALAADMHKALNTAFNYGYPDVLKILLDSEYYQNPGNLNHILRDNNHRILNNICIYGHTSILALLLETPFYQNLQNLAEALQLRFHSILWEACCIGGDATIIEMLLATEFYQYKSNLREALEASQHKLLRDAFNYQEWDAVEVLLNTDYYQNLENLNLLLSASKYSLLTNACSCGREAIVKLLLESDFYQSPDNLHDALMHRNQQALGLACARGYLDIMRILLKTDFYRNIDNFANFIKYRGSYSLGAALPNMSQSDLDNLSPAEMLKQIHQQPWFTQTAPTDKQSEADTKSDAKQGAPSTVRSNLELHSPLLFTNPPQHQRYNQTAAGQSHPIGDLESLQLDEPESSESPRHNAAG